MHAHHHQFFVLIICMYVKERVRESEWLSMCMHACMCMCIKVNAQRVHGKGGCILQRKQWSQSWWKAEEWGGIRSMFYIKLSDGHGHQCNDWPGVHKWEESTSNSFLLVHTSSTVHVLCSVRVLCQFPGCW